MAEINQFLSKDAEKQAKDLLKLMGDLAKSYENAFLASKKLDDQIKKLSKSTDDNKKKKEQLTAIQKEEARILKATATTKAKIEKIRDGSVKLLAKEQEELKKLNKELRAEVTETGKLEGAFRKLNQRRTEAAKRLKDLIASERASTKEIQKAQRAFDRLDKKVQKANRSARQFQFNVGNYPKLFGASTRALGGFLSAFGVVGGIALFARAITDAFKRIREFDKSVVELAGILGKSRKDLASLEKVIIDVAGSSTKTSTEVAKLATALATLGASEAEIKNLIEPVNNLSIGLKATSEEAGELLKGTLNAFQESSTEARRYADVIAKMRTSTALDFERIKDSLGFVAPTAKAVGLTIEGLGARIGVLVNNSVKASRAGRLLNSSFARLIKRGLTLDEALEQVNNSTNKTKTASELFGTEAFGLGLILADNVDKVAELTAEYENSRGTLKKLVDTEMTSMDARLKLLDSGFERFILTITKGDNFISDVFKWTIDDLTKGFNFLSDALGNVDRRFENWKESIRDSDLPIGQIINNVDQLVKKIEETKTKIDESNQKISKGFTVTFGKSAVAAEKMQRKINEELKLNLAGFEKQRDFLVELENERLDAAQAELDRVAALEAEKERLRQLALEAEIQKRKDANAKLLAEHRLLQVQKTALDIRESEEIDRLIEDELQAEIDLNNELLKINQDRLDKELEDKKRHEEEINDINDKAFDELMKKQQDQEDARREIIQASVDLIAEIFTGFQDLRIQQLSDESNALELQRQTQLENAAGDKAKEAQINAQFDRKQAAIKQQQWKAEQNAALTQILIQGAKGAATTIGNVGLPAAIPLLAILAGLVIAQGAFVKAQKPPKFAKGSKGLQKDTHGIVGEAGRELLFMPGGGVALAQKETEGVWPKGTVIKTNKETEQILAANQLKASRENEAAAKNYGELAILSQSIAEDRKSILKAVSERDQYLFEVSKQGIINLIKRNKSGVTTYLNNRFR
ncbi:phage tail tape measure protein [Candidatus Pacearchaeota archaeon]|nr:phage tail tape measure protein [Candidatus Pacearchaeota archaeon]